MRTELEELWQALTARTDYEQCARPRASRLSNSPAAELLERLGRPQDACPAVHVAGSKGKGSTAAYLAAGWRALGKKVGVYSSPHLSDWRERATINGEFASDALWIRALRAVLQASDGQETFFDLLTASAFHLFAEAGCDYVVVEVGLGGRFDSTRVFQPLAAVVTSIELEHEEVLGPGLSQIAWNKAGIFQTGCPAFAGAGIPELALRVLQDEAAQLGEKLWIAETSHPCAVRLEPAHQQANYALAMLVLESIAPDAAAALAELDPSSLRLAGRCEEFHTREGQIVLFDVAHSENSLAAVLDLFRRRYHKLSRGVVFALRDDKDPQQLAAALERRLGPRPTGERWWTCPAGDHPRSADPRLLASVFAAEALARPTLPPGPQALLVTGSTYLVGALRASAQLSESNP
jgi:dihydrofolate synthase / folylpolyglutamate synthase